MQFEPDKWLQLGNEVAALVGRIDRPSRVVSFSGYPGKLDWVECGWLAAERGIAQSEVVFADGLQCALYLLYIKLLVHCVM